MSKKWYPVINYENCVECGACIEKCKNGVYDKALATPKVIYPEGCIDGCRGCQKLCSADAIDYVGDNGGQQTVACQCS
ncbi:MAG: 4Fe-4S binding protein [Acetobacterium sp.]|nr:4Fe-4S binding protein [Acetobacterium sp.]